MPKKSKRRSNTSGGGGSGKARGSGGHDEGIVGGRSAAAKNSADANNWDGDDEAGILTAGAIQMLLERGNNREHSFAKKHAPILQVIGNIERIVEDSYTFCLSDGEQCVWAMVSRRVDGESFNFVANGHLTGNSIIRLRRYLVAYNAVKGRSVAAICRAEILETRVDGMIGSPSFLGSSAPVGSPCSEEAEATVDDAPPPPGGCVSYSERLAIARGILAESGNSDIKSFAKQCCDALNLPRNLTEGFRSLYIMHYCASMEQSLTKEVTDSHGRAVRAFETYLDCVEGCTQRFKSIASDMSESNDTRAMAVYACSLPSGILPYTASNHMNYLRRFIAMSKEVNLHDLPAPLEVDGCQPGEEVDTCIRIDHVKVFLSMLKVARGRLEQFGGLAASMIVDKQFADPNATFGLLLFGGARCDNCGKTPDDAGMNYLFKCKACRLAWYCSESCQADCWSKGHRDCCKKFGSFEEGDLLVLFGLKKKYDLNLSIVRLQGSDVNGRLKVVLVASGTQGADEAIGVFGGSKVVKKNIGHRASAYSAGTIISVKKENLRHCRPLK